MRILIVLGLAVLLSSCASAKYRELSSDGKVVKETKIIFPIWGARQTKGLSIDLKKGKIKLGSSKRNAGDIAASLKNVTEVAAKLAATLP